MWVALEPLGKLKALRDYPQYSVEPYRYCASPSGTSSSCQPGSVEVEAYLLCHGGACVALHFMGGGDDLVVVDAESPEDVERVVFGLLESDALSEHEVEALARFLFAGKDDVRRRIYLNRLRRMVGGRRVAVIRGVAYVLDGGIRVAGEADAELVRELGGVVVDSPVSEVASVILREAEPDFYALGRGGVLFCNSRRRRCLCYPVEGIVDLITRYVPLELREPERWTRRGRGWLAWFGGERYVSECPPRRRGRGGEEEALHLERVAGHPWG